MGFLYFLSRGLRFTDILLDGRSSVNIFKGDLESNKYSQFSGGKWRTFYQNRETSKIRNKMKINLRNTNL